MSRGQEFSLIDCLHAHMSCKRGDVSLGTGDDAALVCPPAGHQLAISTDTLVAGVHFPMDTPPMHIGYKALAVNLSDMAAMGAIPAWVSLSLSMPKFSHREPEYLTMASSVKAFIEGFAQGFSQLANEHNVHLIGGDTTYSDTLSITVNIIGFVAQESALLRSGAQVGDDVYVSGALGGAGYELAHLSILAADDRKALNLPKPCVALGQQLRHLASSCIDVSDGLMGDLTHILNKSSTQSVPLCAKLCIDSIPLHAHLKAYIHKAQTALHDNPQALHWALCAGDEYQLCFTASQSQRAQLEQLPFELTRIGRIDVQQDVDLPVIQFGNAQNDVVDITSCLGAQGAYQHF